MMGEGGLAGRRYIDGMNSLGDEVFIIFGFVALDKDGVG